MTCKDCIHEYCCKYDRFFGVDEVENKCNYFKNKTDFMEVVRCEKCTHSKSYPMRIICHRFGRDVNENGFCSYGQRK